MDYWNPLYGTIKIKPEWCISYGRDYDYDYNGIEKALDDKDFLKNRCGIKGFFAIKNGDKLFFKDFRVPLVKLSYDMEEVYEYSGLFKEELSKFTFSEDANIIIRFNGEDLVFVNDIKDNKMEMEIIENCNFYDEDIPNICASVIRYCKNVKTCAYEVIMDREETIRHLLQIVQQKNTEYEGYDEYDEYY